MASAPTRPVTADHLVSLKKPLTATLRVYHDDDVIAAFQEAEVDYKANASIYGEDEESTVDKKKVYQKARAELEKHSTLLKLTGIGRKRYNDLKNLHPATDEQDAEVFKKTGQHADWNPETFMPALMVETITEPQFTIEQATSVLENWSEGEVNDLYIALIQVNQGRRHDVLGKG